VNSGALKALLDLSDDAISMGLQSVAVHLSRTVPSGDLVSYWYGSPPSVGALGKKNGHSSSQGGVPIVDSSLATNKVTQVGTPVACLVRM